MAGEMSINADEFNRALDAFVEKTGKDSRLFVLKVATYALESVVRLSPVGNPSLWDSGYRPKGYVGGNFRNSWRVGIDSPPPAGEGGPDASGGDSLAEATKLASATNGSTIYISNSAPYANRLEYGWSSQAPTGMVRLTIEDLKAKMAKMVAESFS